MVMYNIFLEKNLSEAFALTVYSCCSHASFFYGGSIFFQQVVSME